MKKITQKLIDKLGLTSSQIEEAGRFIEHAEKWMYDKFTDMLSYDQQTKWRKMFLDELMSDSDEIGIEEHLKHPDNPYRCRPCPDCGEYANSVTRGIPSFASCKNGHKWER